MNLLEAFGVAPDGGSGAYCQECGTFLTHEQALNAGHQFQSCFTPYCEGVLHVDVLGVKFITDTVKYAANPLLSLERTWYHATSNEDWLSSVRDEEALVHIGTERSALNRALDLRRALRWDDDTIWYVHELQLHENLVLLPELEFDNNEDAPTEVYELYGSYKVNGYAYLNVYEDPGSVSLLVNPNYTKIVSTQVLDKVELKMAYDEISNMSFSY